MLRLLDRIEEVLIATLIGVATVIIFVAVLHRFSLGLAADVLSLGRSLGQPWLMDGAKSVYFAIRTINLVWAQELCIILFVWMAKFGAAYGVRTGIHVGVDVLINRLKPETRRWFILLGLGGGALFTGLIGTFGADFVWHMAQTDAVTPDLELPAWIVYLAVPLGSYLMCFRFLQVALAFLRTNELPHHDHGHVDGIDEDPVASVIHHSDLSPKDLAR